MITTIKWRFSPYPAKLSPLLATCRGRMRRWRGQPNRHAVSQFHSLALVGGDESGEPVSNNPEENLERIVRMTKEECPFALDCNEPDWNAGFDFDPQRNFLPISSIESDSKRNWVKTATLKVF